jgi:plastocyanin
MLTATMLFSFAAPRVTVATPVLTETGQFHELYRLPDGSRQLVIHNAPQRVWDNETSRWVGHKVLNRWTESGEIYVLSGRIALQFVKDGVRYYNPTATDERLAREKWAVQAYSDTFNAWLPILVQRSPSFQGGDILENSTGVYLWGVYGNSFGQLHITYAVRDGKPLKHTVTFTPTYGGQYRVVQIWLGVKGLDYVTDRGVVGTLGDVNVTRISGEGRTFKFKSFGKLVIYESHRDEESYQKAILGKIGGKYGAAFLFGPWVLQAGQQTQVDPTTSTYTPTADGYVSNDGTTYATVHDATTGSGGLADATTSRVGQQLYGSTYTIWRSFIQFNTTLLPSTATISAAKICLYGYGDSSSTDFTIRIQKWTEASTIDTSDYDAFDGTNYDDGLFDTSSWTTTGWNNITLTNFTIIQVAGYTNVSIRSGNDVSSTAPTSDEFVDFETSENTNDPFLEVTYTCSPTIGEFTADATFYAGKYGWLNATANDGDGQSDLDDVFVAFTVGAETVKLKYDAGTATFSEASDLNNRITLDASTSTRVSVNSTAYKYAFYLRFAYNATQDSAVDIVSGTGVQDAAANTGNATSTGVFAYENRIEVQSVSVDDSRVNPGDTVTFTVTAQYYNTATAIVNLDSYVTVRVELSGTEKGNNSTFASDGTTTITLTAESTVASHSYNAYATPIAVNQQNQTQAVIVDRLSQPSVTFNGFNSDGTANFTVTATYEYDGSTATGYFQWESPSGTVRETLAFGTQSLTLPAGITDLVFRSVNGTDYDITTYAGTTLFRAATQSIGASQASLISTGNVTISNTSYDADNKRWSFTATFDTANPGYLYVGADPGKPVYISMDGQEKQEGSGWTFSDGVVTITGSTDYVVSWTASGGETSSAGATGGGGAAGGTVIGPAQTVNETGTAPPPLQASTMLPPPPPPNLMFGGTAVIILIVGTALAWSEIRRRLSPHTLWQQRTRNLRKPVKWKQRRWW